MRQGFSGRCSRTRSSRSGRSPNAKTVFWARRGVTLRGVRFDPSLASYLLDPGRHAHRLEDLARQELDGELSEEDAVRGKGKKALNWDEVEVNAVARICQRARRLHVSPERAPDPADARGGVRAAVLRGRAPACRCLGDDGADRNPSRHRAPRGAVDAADSGAREPPRPVHRARGPRLQRFFSAAARNHPLRRARVCLSSRRPKPRARPTRGSSKTSRSCTRCRRRFSSIARFRSSRARI